VSCESAGFWKTVRLKRETLSEMSSGPFGPKNEPTSLGVSFVYIGLASASWQLRVLCRVPRYGCRSTCGEARRGSR
jgi:hypothetical protein